MSKRSPLSLFTSKSSSSSPSLLSSSSSSPHLSSASSPDLMSEISHIDTNDVDSLTKKVEDSEHEAPKAAKVLSKPTSSSSSVPPPSSSSSSSSSSFSSSSAKLARPGPSRPKSTLGSSSSSLKDPAKVSITLSSGTTTGDDAAKSSSSSTSSTPSILQKIRAVGKPSASAGGKHSTLPLPPKAKFPPASAASGLSASASGAGAKIANSTSSLLSKLAPKSGTLKPARNSMSPQQLQEQAQQLQLQLEQQKQLLEQQQKQLQHHQQAQQQLEVQLQQTHEEKLLQQQIMEQQLLQTQLEQQLQQTRLKQQLQELNQRIQQPQISAQARTFIATFPFQPHHTNKHANPSPSDFVQGGTYSIDFAFTPASAVEMYKDWKDSQWLLPQAFVSQLDPQMMVPMHIPFYSFSLFTHSAHNGRVGHFKKGGEPSSVELSTIEFDYVEDRFETSPYSQLHPNVLVYAPTFELVTTPDYDLMQEIWYWNVDDLLLKPRVAAHAHARHSMPFPSRSNSSASIDVKILHSATMPEAWTHAKKRLLKNEQYCAGQAVKKECGCDIVEDVQTDTSFSHIVVKLIYLPVYVWTHAYQGTTYHTVMNGQNGIVSGRRPYALKSSLDSLVKFLAGGEQVMSSKSENITGAISGADLALRDNYTEQTSPYQHDLWYLVFPASDQFLVVVATGWLRITNTSPDTDVEIRAQRRLSSHLSPRSLVLAPEEERVVAYRGAWCLCVLSGDAQSVLISFISTNSGADKEDALGMV